MQTTKNPHPKSNFAKPNLIIWIINGDMRNVNCSLICYRAKNIYIYIWHNGEFFTECISVNQVCHLKWAFVNDMTDGIRKSEVILAEDDEIFSGNENVFLNMLEKFPNYLHATSFLYIWVQLFPLCDQKWAFLPVFARSIFTALL